MRKLHSDKLGSPFKGVRISLNGSYEPLNWRQHKTPESRHDWIMTRSWISREDDAGKFELKMLEGCGKIGPTLPGSRRCDKDDNRYQNGYHVTKYYSPNGDLMERYPRSE